MNQESRVQLCTDTVCDRLSLRRLQTGICYLPSGLPCLYFPNLVLQSTWWAYNRDHGNIAGIVLINSRTVARLSDEELSFWISLFLTLRRTHDVFFSRLAIVVIALCIIAASLTTGPNAVMFFVFVMVLSLLLYLVIGITSSKRRLIALEAVRTAAETSGIVDYRTFLVNQLRGGQSFSVRRFAARMLRASSVN